MVIALIGARALGLFGRVVEDAGDRDRTPVRIDANGAAFIFEGVLGLRGAGREQ